MSAKIHRGALCISRPCLLSMFLSINLVPLFHSARAQEAATAVSLQDSAAPTQSALKSLFTSGQSERPALLNDPKLLEVFYANRDFLPAWSGSTEATNAAIRARASLSDAGRLGLDSAQYFSGNAPPDGGITPGRDAAIYDVLMTDGLLGYANDLVYGGVSPNDVYKDARLPQSKFSASAALTMALKTNSIGSLLVSLPPTHPEYSRLASALARYRSIAAKGGWPTLSGLQAQNGQSAAALYARLAMEDSTLHAVDKPTSAQLENAIKRYQIRNGLTPSGIVNSDMLSELN